MKSKTITELLFFIPLVLALLAGFYAYGIIIALSIISALLYHSSNEKKYFSVDVIVSTILITTNLYFLYLADFKYPYFQLAIIALIASFYFWIRAQKANYDFNHSIWHVTSVLITIFCILAYY